MCCSPRREHSPKSAENQAPDLPRQEIARRSCPDPPRSSREHQRETSMRNEPPAEGNVEKGGGDSFECHAAQPRPAGGLHTAHVRILHILPHIHTRVARRKDGARSRHHRCPRECSPPPVVRGSRWLQPGDDWRRRYRATPFAEIQETTLEFSNLGISRSGTSAIGSFWPICRCRAWHNIGVSARGVETVFFLYTGHECAYFSRTTAQERS